MRKHMFTFAKTGLTLTLLAFLGGTMPARAEVVLHVHLINARTGEPIPRKPIQVWIADHARGLSNRSLHGQTATDGVAVFHIADPFPSGLYIHTGMGGYWEECGRPNYDPKLIMNSGISRMDPCLLNIPNLDRQFHPKPGDVYLYVVHLNLWERIRHCGEWGCQ